LEGACKIKNKEFRNVYIDEANMVDILECFPIFNLKFSQLKLYCDQCQIGTVDMLKTGGVREL